MSAAMVSAVVSGCVPPFTDSTPDRSRVFPVGEALWVWLGGTLLLLVPKHGPVLCGAGGLGTLLGPEGTPVGCCSLVRLLAGHLTHSLVLWGGFGCGGVGGLGVWLCVECCIVDASILLWLSV